MTALAVGAGVLVGLVFALFSAGGGIIAVPAMVLLLDAPLATATGTSLAVVWGAAVAGTVGHARAGRVAWRVVAWVAGPAALGAVLGAKLHPLVPERVTSGLFTALLVFAGLRMLKRSANVERSAPLESPARLVPVGLGVGVVTGFLGVGGGFLMMPVFTLVLGLPMARAVATSMAVICISALSGAWVYASSGDVSLSLLLPVGGGAIVGALAGAPLSGRLPERPMRIGFAVFACSVAVVMVLKMLRG